MVGQGLDLGSIVAWNNPWNFNAVSECWNHLQVYQDQLRRNLPMIKVARIKENQIQHMELHHFFLYNIISSARHSCFLKVHRLCRVVKLPYKPLFWGPANRLWVDSAYLHLFVGLPNHCLISMATSFFRMFLWTFVLEFPLYLWAINCTGGLKS